MKSDIIHGLGKLVKIEKLGQTFTNDKKSVNLKVRCVFDSGEESILEFKNVKKQHPLFKHGHRTKRSNTYAIWLRIRKSHNVCERWEEFSNFLEDMGEQPEGKVLRKIRTNGIYEPSNCKWINHGIGRHITFNGKTMSLTEWAKKLNVNRTMIIDRIKRGWSVEKALSEPVIVKIDRRITFNGKTMSTRGWAKLLNISHQVLDNRIKFGWPINEVITTPIGVDPISSTPLNKYNLNYIPFGEKTMSLEEWSIFLNIPCDVLKERSEKNWSVRKAFSTPVNIKKDKVMPIEKTMREILEQVVGKTITSVVFMEKYDDGDSVPLNRPYITEIHLSDGSFIGFDMDETWLQRKSKK